jgi:alkyl hydroperoxide reductase subunit AhpF
VPRCALDGYNDGVALLSDQDRQQLQETFAELKSDVRLVFFTQALNCETCDIARQILDEVGTLSPRITVEEHNFLLEKDAAAALGINRVPATAIVGPATDAGGVATDPGIRMYGAPHGYEFASLLDGILLVGGAGENGLSPRSKALLASLAEPVHIQVFVTPT